LQVRLVLQPQAQASASLPGLGKARLGWTSWLAQSGDPQAPKAFEPIKTLLMPAHCER
jgi:predicted component of type VI protein secretion system